MKQITLSTAALRCITGLIQAVILYLLYVANQKAIWPATQLQVFSPMLMVTLFVPLLIVQGTGSMRLKTIRALTFFVTLMLIVISYYAVYRQISPSQNIATDPLQFFSPELFIFTCIALFIIQSLTLSGDNDNQFIAHYSSYFDISWKLQGQLFFVVAFTGFFWLLLYLGSSLFSAINLSFFRELITTAWFAIPATTLAVATALHLTDVNVRVMHGIRTLTLILLSWLLPLITGILSLFLLTLFTTGLTPLWQTGRAATLLLSTAVILIILINAVYQDGLNEKLPPIIQRYSKTISSCLLIPVIGLAIYALGVRVQQYGWSVSRIYAAASMMIIAFYAIGYALAVVIRTKARLIESCNIAAAFLILAIYLALSTPLADPARLTVASQLSRLKTGKVTPEKFDFNYLRFEGQRYGKQALQELRDTWQGPRADTIHIKAKEALAQQSQFQELSAEGKKQLIVSHTQNTKLLNSFINQHWEFTDGSINIPSCLQTGPEICHLWITQDAAKNPTILLLGKSDFVSFQQNASGIWTAIGNWPIPYDCREKIYKTAAQGEFKMVSPSLSTQEIEVMGVRLNFNQNSASICSKIK